MGPEPHSPAGLHTGPYSLPSASQGRASVGLSQAFNVPTPQTLEGQATTAGTVPQGTHSTRTLCYQPRITDTGPPGPSQTQAQHGAALGLTGGHVVPMLVTLGDEQTWPWWVCCPRRPEDVFSLQLAPRFLHFYDRDKRRETVSCVIGRCSPAVAAGHPRWTRAPGGCPLITGFCFVRFLKRKLSSWLRDLTVKITFAFSFVC